MIESGLCYPMRTTHIIAQFLVLFCIQGALFGQAQPVDKPVCPSVEVTGPAGIVAPGEIAWFEASITGADPEALDLVWTTSAGKIDKRDGKLRIGIRLTNDLNGLSLTATLEIKGLSEECGPSTDSETISYCGLPTPTLIEEYSLSVQAINKKALSVAVEELDNNPSNQMYIIEYFPVKGSTASINRKLKSTRDYLLQLKFDLSRVTIVTAEAEGNVPLTRIYRVPPGADNPIP